MKIQKKNILIITVLLLIGLNQQVFSQFGSAYQQDARQEGMGSAFTGLADDGEATYYNPAGLSNIKTYEFSATYARQFAGLLQGSEGTSINVGNIGFVYNFDEKIGTIGFKWFNRTFTQGNIYNASENTYFLGYGRKLIELDENLSFGAGIKILNYGFYDNTGLGMMLNNEDLTTFQASLDLSTLYNLTPEFSLGFSLKDIFKSNSGLIDNTDDLFNLNYTLGGSYKYDGSDLIVFDLNSEDNEFNLNLGTEYNVYLPYRYRKLSSLSKVVFRAGTSSLLDFENPAYSLNLGYGFDFTSGFRIDYGLKIMFGEILDTPMNHVVTFVFNRNFSFNNKKEFQYKDKLLIKNAPAVSGRKNEREYGRQGYISGMINVNIETNNLNIKMAKNIAENEEAMHDIEDLSITLDNVLDGDVDYEELLDLGFIEENLGKSFLSNKRDFSKNNDYLDKKFLLKNKKSKKDLIEVGSNILLYKKNSGGFDKNTVEDIAKIKTMYKNENNSNRQIEVKMAKNNRNVTRLLNKYNLDTHIIILYTPESLNADVKAKYLRLTSKFFDDIIPGQMLIISKK